MGKFHLAPKWAIAIVMIVLMLAVGAYIGRTAGERDAEASKERLSLLWPAVMDLPQQDRGFLAGLAMTCRLSAKEVEKEAVIACLRSAVRDPDAVLPKDIDKSAAPARLEQMLADR